MTVAVIPPSAMKSILGPGDGDVFPQHWWLVWHQPRQQLNGENDSEKNCQRSGCLINSSCEKYQELNL
jgi:hypothetical protein